MRAVDFAAGFRPCSEKRPESIISLLDVFLNRTRNRALVETVAVESGRSVRFLIEVKDRRDGVTVRLEPMTDPEKTPAVKRSVARVAQMVHSLSEHCRYGKTNLEDYLAPGA